MSKTRPVVTFVFALLVVSVGSGAPLAFAVNWSVHIRENNQNYTVVLSLLSSECSHYNDDQACGNSAHRTQKGSRYFDHYHVAYSIPRLGSRNGDLEDPVYVTETNIDAYWYWYYTDYLGLSALPIAISNQQNFNCWSYALNYQSCWVNKPQYIGNDDWNREYVQYATLAMNTEHARLVAHVNWWFGIPWLDESDEKFCESKKYQVFFTYENPDDIQVYWVPKP